MGSRVHQHTATEERDAKRVDEAKLVKGREREERKSEKMGKKGKEGKKRRERVSEKERGE